MANETFRFKRFEVSHARSSMRVGTDAVLLGAWADASVCDAKSYPQVLDIGCGCGLIGLMLAQRCPSCRVLGIDIDLPSVEEATENARRSPFADRVEYRCADVRDFVADDEKGRYDLILCNPPYFTEDTLPPEQRRSMARNAVHLSFAELVQSACSLMSAGGAFAVVLPMQERSRFVGEALKSGLHIRRECQVQTTLTKTPKRVLLEFGFQLCSDVCKSTIVLQDVNGKRSEGYCALCRDFYL